MHTIHHTKAVILKSEPRGEYDKTWWLFTEDFGLVRAVTTGIRKPTAKLKSQLVEYAFVDVDLVQGRDVWRLVSATALYNPITDTRSPCVRPYVRALGTLVRFLVDEGEHRALFAHILEIARAMGSGLDPRAYDALAIWRILVHLGYIDGTITAPFTDAARSLDDAAITALVHTVNETIKQTHL